MTGREAQILFSARVATIRYASNEIARLTAVLAGLRYRTDALDNYDLKQSVQLLRDAADQIEAIREKQDVVQEG